MVHCDVCKAHVCTPQSNNSSTHLEIAASLVGPLIAIVQLLLRLTGKPSSSLCTADVAPPEPRYLLLQPEGAVALAAKHDLYLDKAMPAIKSHSQQ